MEQNKSRMHDRTFAIAGVSCSADSFVVTENFVIRVNFSDIIPPIASLQTVMFNKHEG